MFRIARDYSERALPGSLALIAAAHYERWLWDVAFEKDPAIAAMWQSYFHNDDVWDELRHASESCLSESHPDARNVLWADAWFAKLFTEAGSIEMAEPHLERLGGHLDIMVWRRPKAGWWLNIKRLEARLLPVRIDA